jgi:riboflavin kinase / FMN adenylyltransferase
MSAFSFRCITFVRFNAIHFVLEVFHHIQEITAVNPVVTIGIFDGVHRGHAALLKRVRNLAAHYRGESVVITLWPHPRFVLQPDNQELRLLTSLEEKISLIRSYGIDKLLILKFDADLANIPYDLFVKEYLVERIHARHVVVGFNHHFGKDRKGTFENLQKVARECHIEAERLEPVIFDDIRISSSGIRHMIAEGRMDTVGKALGYPYFISGEVVRGKQLGRTIGFPTANVRPGEPFKLLPRNGVYAVEVQTGDRKWKGMLNIGTRPTVDAERNERTIEVHLFDFNEDLYGRNITILFHAWLRNEIKFNSLQELKDQLTVDKAEVMKLFSSPAV